MLLYHSPENTSLKHFLHLMRRFTWLSLVVLLSLATVAQAADQSVFTTQTPVSPDTSDGGTSYELGMKFQSTTDGYLKAIRYYKAPSDSGTHQGRIWSSAGALLASVNFTNETTSGWQEQALDTPLSIQANTQYVVSVNINSHYAFARGGLATSIVNGDLSSVADGNNGVFGSPGAFPTNSWNNSNYFRDIVFATDIVATPTTSIVSGNDQSGDVATTLPQPLVVEVRDGAGNPQSGTTVDFTVTAGGGSVSPASAVTDANGQASTTLTLGSAAGTNTVNAAAAGIGSVDFNATATVPAPVVAIVSGNDQSGDVATTLPQPLVVEVRDAAGNPQSGTTVDFTVTAGGGSVSPASAVTDANGQASTTLTLGSAAGTNTVNAAAAGIGSVDFNATATVPAPVVAIVSGNDQSGDVATALPQPLVVEVRDGAGSPQSGTTVDFTVTSGGGAVSPASAVTDANGQASTTLTLGSAAGTNTVNAAAAGIGSVDFNATATVPAPVVAIVSGNNQSGDVATTLPQPLVVEVRDGAGSPQSGTTVDFTVTAGGGAVSPASAVTDANGQASTTLTLGSAAGTNTVNAAAAGIGSVDFNATATVPAPVVAIVSGNDQSGDVATTLPQPLVVEVRDAAGNPQSGTTVDFTVTAGGGAVSTVSAVTDANGQASTTLTLGSAAGTNTVNAAAAGIGSVDFNATATLALLPTQIELTPASSSANLLTPVDYQATIQDQLGNPVTTATDPVTFAVTGVTGTFSPSATVVPTSGVASVTFTPASIGTATITASAAGLTGGTASLTVGAISDQTVFTTQTPVSPDTSDGGTSYELGMKFQSTTDGYLKAIRYYKAPSDSGTHQGRIWSSAGALLASVNFTNETTSGWQEQALDTPLSIQANTQYVVSVNINSHYAFARGGLATSIVNGDLSSVADGNNGVFGSPGAFPTNSWNNSNYFRDIVFATDIVATPTTSIVSGNDQSGDVATTLPQPLVVEVRDGAGNPQSGTTVDFTVTAGGGSVSPASAVTDANGQASTTLTLGSAAGTNTVNAAAAGIGSVDFNATATVPAPVVAIVSGNDQSGDVATTLPQPLVVEVRDAAGNPQSGTTVDFTVTAGGGSVSPASAVTDANGQASTTLTLGSAAGTNTVNAAAAGIGSVDFTATATLAANPTIAILSGNDQSGDVATALPQPLVVEVRDGAGSPQSGTTVDFTVTSGGGAVSPASAVTDANGQASTTLTLGSAAGTNTVNAAAAGIGSVDFTATATLAANPTIAILSGNDQSGDVATALPQPLVVEVRDGAGSPQSGTTVDFTVTSGGGAVSPASAVTDANGQASTTLTLGSAAGTNTVNAAAAGIGSVDFNATATVPAPVVAIVSGNNQSGDVATTLPQPLVVEVRDGAGSPQSGTTVDFTVTAGGGAVSPASAVTDANGQASTTLTLGSAAGTNTVNAAAAGIGSVDFNATATVPAPVVAIVSGNDQSGDVATTLPQPLVVEVRDAAGNPQSGTTVDFTVTAGGGAVSTVSAVTDANGQASTTLTLGSAAGTNTVNAAAAGIGSVDFNATATLALLPTQIELTPASSSANLLTPVDYQATIQDQLGNPVTTATDPVTFAVTGVTGTFSPSATVVPTSGVASVTFTPASIGTATITASAAGLTGGTASLTVGAISDQTVFTTQTPVSPDTSDGGTSYELGMKFQSTTDGYLKAIRYYKAPSDSGTHQGRIWSSAGALLASVNFTNETTSGWQEQALDTPLSIQANTQYVVSVNINSHYAFARGGLATSIVNGDLSSVADGNNGVFGSPGAFPTNSWNNSNYFRDIVFATDIVATPTTSIVSGNDQSGDVATTLPQPLVVEVRDGAGNPQSGTTVDFTVTAGGGSVSPASAVTDANGQASTTLTLGSAAGTNTVNAAAAGIGSVDFNATATVPAPVVAIVSGNDQSGDVATTLPQPLVVEVRDAAGNPQSGTTVDFTVTAGGGSVSPASAVTDANGQASTTLTLGSAAGTNTVNAAAAGIGSVDFNATASTNTPNPIVLENEKPGNPDYLTFRIQYSETEIIGYADATSVTQGDVLSLKISMAQPGEYLIDVYRFGYYGGAGARLVTPTIGPLSGITQQDCLVTEPATRLVECQWSTSYALTIGNDWTSGLYMARLSDETTGKQYPIFFVVRDDSSTADIVFQSSLTTSLAYSNFGTPNEQYSLYGFNSTGGQRALKVSFDRPVNELTNYSNVMRYEYNMIRWLESQGYDVTYVTNLDVHENPASLLQHKVFLSVGHDEYWSREIRDGVEGARDAGVNLGFFSANTAYWRVRFEPSSSGQPNRIMVCYKDPLINDPVEPTYLWRGQQNSRPENELLGLMYTGDYGGLYGGFDFVVTNSADPYFNNTGLLNNDSLSALVGYEWDAVIDNGFSPPGLVILSESTVSPENIAPELPPGTDTSVSHAVKYTAISGAKVFSTGSIQWVWGLDSDWVNPPREDARAKQFVINIFADFGVRPATPDPGMILP